MSTIASAVTPMTISNQVILCQWVIGLTADATGEGGQGGDLKRRVADYKKAEAGKESDLVPSFSRLRKD